MVSRRNALKLLGGGLASVAGQAIFPRFHFGTARAAGLGGHVIVTLYMGGGWDGGAIAQPASGPSYDATLAARPTLCKRPDQLALLTSDLGLHPSLQFCAEAFRAGEAIVFPTAGIITGNSGSHEVATLDVIKGLYDGNKEFRNEGFVAAILNKKYQGVTAAEFLAFDSTSGNSVLNGSIPSIIKAGNLSSLGFDWFVTGDRNYSQDIMFLLSRAWQGTDQDKKITATANSLESTLTRIKQATTSTTFSPAFPNTGIGGAFQQAFIAIANFIDVGLESVSMSTGGFDTHNNQDPVVQQGQAPMGLSANLLGIDNALRAFVSNLKRAGLWERVTIVTLSEFGRTARENGSRGTDHGQGTAYIMMGGAVAGGQVVGNIIQPQDYQRGSNSFPVSVPVPAIVAQISEKMGVARADIYPPEVLTALPPMPALFRA